MLDDATPGGPSRDEALETTVTRPREGAVVLTVAGEIDTLTAAALEAALVRLTREPEQVLAVDLTEVTFLASSGLAVLVEGARLAGTSGRRLRLVAEGRPVVRPLAITGTDQLFDLHDSVESALAP